VDGLSCNSSLQVEEFESRTSLFEVLNCMKDSLEDLDLEFYRGSDSLGIS